MTNYKLNRIFLSTLCSLLFALISPLLSIHPAQQYVILVINDGARYAETSQAITAKILGDKLV